MKIKDHLFIKKFIFFIPIFFLIICVYIRNVSGFFWFAYNFDPAYAYLMNSLSVVQLLPIGHSDHPGSTMQLIGGAVLVFCRLLNGQNDIVQSVVNAPEYYLNILYLFILIFQTFIIIIAGFFCLKWTDDLICTLLFQLGIYISYTNLVELAGYTPELLMINFSLIVSLIALYQIHCFDCGKSKDLSFIYGIVMGLGVATKITFIPLVVLPLFTFNKIKSFIIYFIVLVFSFVVTTVNPLMNFSGFKWFFKTLYGRKGYNVPINKGVNRFQAFIDGLDLLYKNILKDDIFLLFIFIFFILIGIVLILLLLRKKTFLLNFFYIRLWLGMFSVLFLQVLLVANGPGARLRYMVPIFGLLGLLLFFIWHWISKTTNSRNSILKILFLLFVSIVIFLNINTVLENKRHKAGICYKLKNKIDKEYLESLDTICYYPASSKKYALYFGNAYANYNFSSVLSKTYPGFYRYNVWNGNLYKNFSKNKILLKDLFINSSQVLLFGSKWMGKHFMDSFNLKDNSYKIIYKGEYEWIVVLNQETHFIKN